MGHDLDIYIVLKLQKNQANRKTVTHWREVVTDTKLIIEFIYYKKAPQEINQKTMRYDTKVRNKSFFCALNG